MVLQVRPHPRDGRMCRCNPLFPSRMHCWQTPPRENTQLIFEDDCLLVVNKPAGLVVNRAESVKGETVQEWVEEKLKIKSEKLKVQVKSDQVLSNVNGQVSLVSRFGNEGDGEVDWDIVNRQAFYERAGIVHRLDKETSGVLVIAKTPEVFVELLRQFRDREVKKTYWALVHGKIKDTEGVIETEVGRLPWNRERFGVLAGGRKAVTRYRVLKTFKRFLTSSRRRPGSMVDNRQSKEAKSLTVENVPTMDSRLRGNDKNIFEIYTLIELEPMTGRTHQIRIHMKHIGHPVVGDEFYAGRKTARKDREWCLRLWLHAKSLELKHPMTKKRMKFEAEVPEELLSTIKT